MGQREAGRYVGRQVGMEVFNKMGKREKVLGMAGPLVHL